MSTQMPLRAQTQLEVHGHICPRAVPKAGHMERYVGMSAHMNIFSSVTWRSVCACWPTQHFQSHPRWMVSVPVGSHAILNLVTWEIHGCADPHAISKSGHIRTLVCVTMLAQMTRSFQRVNGLVGPFTTYIKACLGIKDHVPFPSSDTLEVDGQVSHMRVCASKWDHIPFLTSVIWRGRVGMLVHTSFP